LSIVSDWIVATLAVIFLIHLVVFARLAIIRGERYYWLVSSVFLVLTASFSLRVFAPGIELAAFPLHLSLRYLAWALAAVTLPMLAWRLRKRRQ
jgi:hypothetical protein